MYIQVYGYSSEKKVNLLVWERTNWRRGYEQTGEKVEERKEEAARLITALPNIHFNHQSLVPRNSRTVQFINSFFTYK